MTTHAPATDDSTLEPTDGLSGNDLSWYRLCFPDRGAGATRWHGYVEAENEAVAREVAARTKRATLYDTTAGTVSKAGETVGDIENGLLRGGPNEAIRRDSSILRKSDFFPDVFDS